MGGDEFVMLIAGGDPEELESKVETHARGRSQGRRDHARTLRTVAQRRHRQLIPKTAPMPSNLLAEADRRMYKNKRARRKATVLHLEPPIPSPEIQAAAS